MQRRSPRNQNKSIGKKGEDYACQLLLRKGFKIVERNFSGKFGEIDIIAMRDNTLFFVEVKTRKSLKYGYPEEAVTDNKVCKIKKTGEYYSLLHPQLPKKLRVDVVSLIYDKDTVVYERMIQVY